MRSIKSILLLIIAAGAGVADASCPTCYGTDGNIYPCTGSDGYCYAYCCTISPGYCGSGPCDTHEQFEALLKEKRVVKSMPPDVTRDQVIADNFKSGVVPMMPVAVASKMPDANRIGVNETSTTCCDIENGVVCPTNNICAQNGMPCTC